MNTPNGRDEIIAMFGDPVNYDGTQNAVWVEKNIKVIKPPDEWQLYYQLEDRIVPVRGIRVHILLKDVFLTSLEQIWDYAKTVLGSNEDYNQIRAWIHQNRLDVHGGGFNFRKKRDSRSLSLHSFGIAIDWDPLHNPRQKPLSATLPDWWYDIWAANGWTDGRSYKTPDPMHLQFATGA